jgi:hypothetical protein
VRSFPHGALTVGAKKMTAQMSHCVLTVAEMPIMTRQLMAEKIRRMSLLTHIPLDDRGTARCTCAGSMVATRMSTQYRLMAEAWRWYLICTNSSLQRRGKWPISPASITPFWHTCAEETIHFRTKIIPVSVSGQADTLSLNADLQQIPSARTRGTPRRWGKDPFRAFSASLDRALLSSKSGLGKKGRPEWESKNALCRGG